MLVKDGYFNLWSESFESTTNPISLALKAFVLITQCTIGIMGVYKMLQRSKGNKVGSGTQNLFISSWLLASICTTIGIIHIVLGYCSIDTKVITTFIFSVSYGFFFISLLSTLAWRLHVTFNESVYRMSPFIRYSFIALLIFLSIGSVANAVPVLILDYFHWKSILVYTSTILLILYFISSGLAVYVFACNLSKLAKSRSTSMRDIGIDPKKAVQLTRQQQDLSDLAARYIMLFLIAITSTALSLVSFEITYEIHKHVHTD